MALLNRQYLRYNLIMIYIESTSTDPCYNLALEEYVFDSLDRSKDYFMLWQNDNAVIVGKYQNTAEEINQAVVDREGIRVVRRLSGGGAVYHDIGNLNYTLIVGQETTPDFDFRLFVLPVIDALTELGVTAGYTGRNDLTIDGKKFSGNAQYAKNGRIMHHGCIMLNTSLEKVQEALNVSPAKIESKSIKSVRSRVTTINEYAPRPISMESFKEVLKKHVLKGRDDGTYELTDADRAAIGRLVRDKYGTWEWNYGRSPSCSIRRERKYDCGLVCAHMEVEHGQISEVHLSGDFFGNRDLHELEEALTGLPLDEHLIEQLSLLPVGEYIHGMTAGELAGLLR